MNEHPEIISGSDRLSRALAEELKLPLTQILRQVEVNRQNSTDKSLELIETNAETAINLIDNFLLSSQLNMGQLMLELEPVSITSALYQVAEELQPFAKMYDCKIEIHVQKKHNPVIANRRALITALSSLGYGFIETAKTTNKSSNIIRLSSRNTPSGVMAGIFSNCVEIDAKDFNKGKNLYGFSRQPINSLSFPGGASIYIASSILQAMASRLRVASHEKISGLGVDLLTTQQMSLI